MTDVDREAVVSGGDDAHDVPLSSGRNVGTKVADEDAGAASILDAKSPGVGIAGNENVSGCEDLPPENFPPGGLDYGDALQDASSVEEVPAEDDDLLLSISSDPSTQEALLSSQDFLSIDPESAPILVSSQYVPSSNPETGGIMVSSQELPSSSNPDSPGKHL